jgi:hypothetical protein
MTRQSRAHRRAKWRPGSDYNMKAAEAAEFLGLSTRKLAQLRQQGLGPLYVSCRRRNWYSLENLALYYNLHIRAKPKKDSDGE